MNKPLLLATAAAALAMATPAAAQISAYADGAPEIENRIAQLEARVAAGIRSGEIDRSEARNLRFQLNQLARLHRQYSFGGLSAEERADLRARIRAVRADVRLADRGSWDRFERRGDWAEFEDDRRGQLAMHDRIDRLEMRLDAGIRSGEIDRREAFRLRRELEELERLERDYSRDGLSRAEHDDLQRRILAARQRIRIADRGSYDRFDRDEEWADFDDPYGRYYGRGGPDESLDAWCTDDVSARSGIGGFLQSLLGVGGLRVGQRVTGNLYAVPYEHRDVFRDSYNHYYRSDGRAIYEIDARTHVVTRVCTMPR